MLGLLSHRTHIWVLDVVHTMRQKKHKRTKNRRKKREKININAHTHADIHARKRHSLIHIDTCAQCTHRFCVVENKLIAEHYRQVGIYSNRNNFFSDEISDSGLFCSISFNIYTYDNPRARSPLSSCTAVCCVCPILDEELQIKYMVVSVRVAYTNI